MLVFLSFDQSITIVGGFVHNLLLILQQHITSQRHTLLALLEKKKHHTISVNPLASPQKEPLVLCQIILLPPSNKNMTSHVKPPTYSSFM